jgi:hypothetical protein
MVKENAEMCGHGADAAALGQHVGKLGKLIIIRSDLLCMNDN